MKAGLAGAEAGAGAGASIAEGAIVTTGGGAVEGVYGPWILSLSAHSEVLETFADGRPVIAIHGTVSCW